MLLNIDNNAKTIKGQAVGVMTGVLYLAPSTLSGRNVCPSASAGCIAACLNTAGRGGMHMAQNSRIRKTQEFHNDRPEFLSRLVKDIGALVRKADKAGLDPAVRLNGTSDLPWEKYPVTIDGVKHANLMAAFPDVQFYDYTKIKARAVRFALAADGSGLQNWPSNYHLTFSLSESNETVAASVLKAGCSVAVVFGDGLPDKYALRDQGAIVTDGDLHDVRFRDRGVIVGLKAKGRARHDSSGFVRFNG